MVEITNAQKKVLKQMTGVLLKEQPNYQAATALVRKGYLLHWETRSGVYKRVHHEASWGGTCEEWFPDEVTHHHFGLTDAGWLLAADVTNRYLLDIYIDADDEGGVWERERALVADGEEAKKVLDKIVARSYVCGAWAYLKNSDGSVVKTL